VLRVVLAGERRVVRGRRLRVDTTVVETNIHDPTDRPPLAEGVRVLTRTLQRLRAAVTEGVVPRRDRTRSVARRVFAIVPLSRRAGQDLVKTRMRTLDRQLMGHPRAVVRQAERAVPHVAADTVGAVGLAQLEVEGLAQQLREPGGLVRRALAQTRARILAGNTHDPDKRLSLVEPPNGGDPQGQSGEAHRVRHAGDDPRSRGVVHHRRRRRRGPRPRPGALGPVPRTAGGAFRPRAARGRGGRGRCLSAQ
jgi:IS5 family transposase